MSRGALARRFLKAPGYMLATVAMLAVGIGGATAMFTVVESVLVRPLAYPDADRLVSVRHLAPGAPGLASVSEGLRPSPSMYFTYAAENRSFEHIGLWDTTRARVLLDGRTEELDAVGVTDGVFQALSVPPELGRWLSAEDMRPGAPLRVVISYSLWQGRFGGDPGVIGRSATVNDATAVIVGVMPRGFTIADRSAELYLPAQIDKRQLTLPPFCCRVIARLRPGTTLEQANADVDRMLPIWAQSWPYQGDPGGYLDVWRISADLHPLKQDVLGNVDRLILTIAAIIAIVLLIAAANVTNLLLVRAEARRHEVGIRAALGAGIWRIAREEATEAFGLALIGGFLGLPLASYALAYVVSSNAVDLPRAGEIALDSTSLLFALVIAAAIGAFVAAVAVVKHRAVRLSDALRAGGRNMSQSRRRHRTQNTLIVVQVALALVLLAGSGLMIRTFQGLVSVDPGFSRPESVQTLRIAIPESVAADAPAVARVQNEVVDAISALPGVDSVALASSVPLDGSYRNWDGIDVQGRELSFADGARPMRNFKNVSPGHFRTLGTTLVAGREFSRSDTLEQRPVAIVSENLARELWGSPRDALGERIRVMEDTPWREIVGVVADVRENGLAEAAPATVYWPTVVADFYANSPWYVQRATALLVRSPLAGSIDFVNRLNATVQSVSPEIPVTAVETLESIYDRSLARTSFVLLMIGVAAAIAVALGVIGLYAVLSYALAERRGELAIRLALGEPRGVMQRRLVGSGLVLAGCGIVLGIAAAAGMTGMLEAMLFDVDPLDPSTFGVVAVLLLGVAAFASYLPARRAASIEPVEALRES